MTASASSLPDLAEPPAINREDTAVLDTLTTETPLRTPDDVPLVALREGEKIVCNPEDGSDVVWIVQDVRRDEDGNEVIDYRTPDGESGRFTVADPGTRFTVEVRL